MKGGFFYVMAKVCEFGKKVKKKLIDIVRNQDWLITEVQKDTDKYFDSSYLYKILTGSLSTPSIITSICKILDIEENAKNDQLDKKGKE